MNNPMDKLSIIAMQYGGLVLAIVCAVTALWGYFGGWLNIGWVITLSYIEFCALAIGFVSWYVRWYWSDSFVRRIAKQSIGLDPELVEAVVEHHPRKADIRREIGRLTGQ